MTVGSALYLMIGIHFVVLILLAIIALYLAERRGKALPLVAAVCLVAGALLLAASNMVVIHLVHDPVASRGMGGIVLVFPFVADAAMAGIGLLVGLFGLILGGRKGGEKGEETGGEKR